jgi:hypothetical protein
MKRIASSCLVFASLAAVGCTSAVGEQGERTGSSAQAYTDGYYLYTWQADIDQNTGLSSQQWTCFLAGVGGEIASNLSEGGSLTGYAGATIENGDWHMLNRTGYWSELTSGTGSSISCVPVANRTGIAHWTGGTAIKLGSASADPNLVCGLIAIGDTTASGTDVKWRVNGPSGLGSGDSAYTYVSGGEWYLGGSGNAEAWATCVDRTPGTPGWAWEYNGGSGTSNVLQQNIDTTQCFLTGVGGWFGVTNSPSQGVWINYASSSQMYSETIDEGQALGVTCIQ